MEELDKLMSNFSRATLLLACFGIVISMAAACVPVASPTPAAATPANTITNILWQWTSVTNRPTGATTEVPDPQDYTITFRDDGTLNGQADCNTFTGTYSQAVRLLHHPRRRDHGRLRRRLTGPAVPSAFRRSRRRRTRRHRQPGAGDGGRRAAHVVRQRRRGPGALIATLTSCWVTLNVTQQPRQTKEAVVAASTQTTRPQARFARFIPILSWLPHYDRAWLTVDVIAGLTLWGLVVPEAMAYAGIAGLPPQAGLYTLLAALLVYALLGTSRHLVVQATSATAALLASSVAAALVATAAANASDPATYQAYASAFVLVVGLVFLVAGLAKLGFITQFLSKPVMDGFVMGLAIFVAVGQLNKLFGVPKPDGNTIEKLIGIVKELPQANWATFAVGAAALALLFLTARASARRSRPAWWCSSGRSSSARSLIWKGSTASK